MIEEREQLPFRHSWTAVAILTVCYVMSIADRLVVSLLVDPIRADLALTDLQLSVILGPAFAVSYAVFSLPLGRLADLVNRRNLVAASIAAWSAFTIGCGLAWNFVAMLAARIGVGVGEAGLTPAAYSMLSDRFAPSRLGRAMGVYLMGGVLGNAAAFVGGGMLYGAFASLGPMTVPGVGMLAAWQLTLITLGAAGLLVAAVVIFQLAEPARHAASERPTIRSVMALALRPTFIWMFVAYATMSIIVYGYISWLPTYLMRTFDLSVTSGGQYVGLIVVTGGLTGPLASGWLADRWRGRRSATPMRLAALLAIALSIGSFLTFQQHTLSSVVAGCIVVSFLMSGMLVLVPLTIQLLSANRLRGHMTGIALMIGNVLGQSVGPTSIPFLSETAFPGLGMAGAMAWMFATTALVSAIAALGSYSASPRREIVH